MTVAELILHLQQFSGNAVCIYRCYSDWDELQPQQIHLETAEESKKTVIEESEKERLRREKEGGRYGASTTDKAVCYRNGAYCIAYLLQAYPEGESPVYQTVVCFPGN